MEGSSFVCFHETKTNDQGMRILHLSASKGWGGGENHIENLCRELNKDGVENFVLCARNYPFHSHLRRTEIITESAPLLIKLDLRYVFKILVLCKKYRIDVIHIHDTTALTLAVMARKIKKLPPLILSKKTSFPIKDRPRTLYKYNHPDIRKILCVSKETQRVTAKNIKDPSKLTVIYHGTTMNKSIETPFQLRKGLTIPEDKFIVGHIGNHIRAKNLETFILVADYLINKKKLKNYRFVQIGIFTKLTPAYLEQINELGLNDFITFLDFIPNASNFIPQFDISLLTSQSEGVPQFIYESFYHRIPVISTNVGGIPEIITDGKNGMLTKPYEVEGLGNKLIALSKDKILQNKFTENAFIKLQENFTVEIMAKKTLAEYKKLHYGKN